MAISSLENNQPVLQQYDCSTLREWLNQKLSRQYAVRDFAIKADAMVQQHRANAKIDLLQELIAELPPVA